MLKIILLFLLLPFTILVQREIKIIDSETSESIPFAVIIDNDKKEIAQADNNGTIRLTNIAEQERYRIRCLGYKNVVIQGKELKRLHTIKLDLLPIEINPIIITSNRAFTLIEQAIDETKSCMPKPNFYLEHYNKDVVMKDSMIVAESNATIILNIRNLLRNDGCRMNTRLKGISHSFENDFDIVNYKFNIYNSSYINSFYLSKKAPEFTHNSIFYTVESSDSTIIVGFRPKSTYIPDKTFLISGRYIIDRETMRIKKIESFISSRLIDYQNKKVLEDEKNDYILKNFHRIISLSELGLPVYFKEEIHYTRKNYDTTCWKNISEKKIKSTDKYSYDELPLRTYISYDKPFIYHEPHQKNIDFDREFNTKFYNLPIDE
ncbi:MAG: hypothetical protein ACK5L7_03580 [Paludibacteraceae bacterium]